MENCKQLFDDLVKIIKNDRKSHFFGSIVSVYNPDGKSSEYLIIDGQQRLTTVSLLFLAMYNLIQNNVVVPDSPVLAQQIYEEYLVDKWQPQETRIKLKPVKNDSKAFSKLFDDNAAELNGIDEATTFAIGFKLGVRLVAEAMIKGDASTEPVNN